MSPRARSRTFLAAPRFCLTIAASLALALLAAPTTAWACAACGNPSLPRLPTGTGATDEGAVSLSVSAQTSALWVSHPAGCADPADCDEVVVQPEHTHEVFSLPVALNLSAQWSVTANLGLEAELPLRLVSQTASYETPDGEEYTPIDAGVHHRTEVLAGLGDAQLRVRGTIGIERWWLSGAIGTTLPFGSTVEDPFEAGDRGESHQHVQFGNGTFDPVFSASLTRGWFRSQWSLYGDGQVSLYENRHGFRAGTQGLVGLLAGWKARPKTMPYALVEGSFQGPERWGGEIRQDALLGRRELRGGLGIRATVGRTTIDAAVRAPLYRKLIAGEEEPGDLRAPFSASISLGWRLGG